MTYATLLVNLEAGRPNGHLLQTAAEVAERFGAGVIGVAACQPMQMVYGGDYAFADMLEQDRQDIARDVEAAEAGSMPPCSPGCVRWNGARRCW